MTEDFNRHLQKEEFEEAYALLLRELKSKPKKKELIELSKRLSSALRRKAQELANRKADREAIGLEKILKKVIVLNGEGFYG